MYQRDDQCFRIKSLHDFNATFGPGAEGFLAVPGIGEPLVPETIFGVRAPSDPAPPSERAA